MSYNQNNPWGVPEMGGLGDKGVQIPSVQAPPAPQVAPPQPGIADQMGQQVVQRSIDDTVTPWLEETGSSIMDNGLGYGLQEGGMKAMEGIASGSSLTNGFTTGTTGLTATGAGSQAAMLAEQGFLPETLSALQSTAAAATPAATGAATAATGAGAAAAGGGAAMAGLMAAAPYAAAAYGLYRLLK